MSKIKFEEKTHTYTKNERNYISVTQLIGKYKNKFDSEHWSNYKACEKILGEHRFGELIRGWERSDPSLILFLKKFVNQQELSSEIETIRKSWKENNRKAITKGNIYHNSKEQTSYILGFETNPFSKSKFDVIKRESSGDLKEAIETNLFDLEDGYYPELLLWNDKYLLAGTADRVFIETSTNKKGEQVRFVDIDDYKTNKQIRKSNRYNKMLAPMDKLDDCNYNHYRVQISLYGWMLEQFGYKVRNTAFTHFNRQYKFRYMKGMINNLMKHYKNNG